MRLIILITLLVCASQINAQDLNDKDVPGNMKTALMKNSAVKKAKWNKDGDSFEASFKKDGKEQSIVFDSSGKIIETETEIAKDELPAFIIQQLDKEYYGFKLEEIATIKSSQGLQYEVEVEKCVLHMSFCLILRNSCGKQSNLKVKNITL